MHAKRALGAMLVLTVSTIGFIGCNGGTGVEPPPVNDTRTYGPPYNAIVYVDNSGHVGTGSPSGLATLLFVPNVGAGGSIIDPGTMVLWKPTSTLTNPDFFMYDTDAEAVKLVNASGTVTDTYTGGLEDMFSSTSGGSRIAFVRNSQDQSGNQEIQVEGIAPIVFSQTVAVISSPFRVNSRPSIRSDASRILVAELNTNVPNLSQALVLTLDGSTVATLPGRVYSPTYSPSGGQIAYIEGPNGAAEATTLVITDALFNEQGRFQFNTYGLGASALNWSPNGSKIALYAGIYSSDPALVIFTVSTNSGSEVVLDSGKVAMDATLHPNLACPEWNGDGTMLVLCVTSESNAGTFNVVTSTLDGVTNPIVRGLLKPVHPTWLGSAN